MTSSIRHGLVVAAVLALSVGLAGSVGTAFAQAPSAERVDLELPLDGRPLVFQGGTSVAVGMFRDAAGRMVERESRQGPTRFWLVGTVSNRLDGSERDAFATRRVQTFEPSAANVILPEGARVLERDPHRHAYLIEVPTPEARVVLPIAAWASRALVTRSEMVAALSGRIRVEVVRPAVAPAVAPTAVAAPVVDASDGEGPWALLVGALLLALLVVVAFVRSRRNKDELIVLMHRARIATDHVRGEARRLGPAFDDVVTRADETLDSLEKVRCHVVAIDAANARIRGLEGAEARAEREALAQDRADTVVRMAERVDHLEGVAAKLAAQVAGQARDASLDATLAALDEDVDVAISADEEARSVVDSVGAVA